MKIGRRNLNLHWTAWKIDLAFALIVGFVEIIGTYFVDQHQSEQREFDMVILILLTASAAALVFRRQYPRWVLLFTMGIILLYLLLDYPKGPIFVTMYIAFYTAVMQGHRLIAWAVLIAEFLMFPWLPFFVGIESAPSSSGVFGLAGWLLVLATLTEIVYIRQQRLIRIREEEARRRTGEERLRIARELHDVLGHNISLISVQAGVALHLMDKQPEQARIALSVIKDASKEALRELRSVLDVLRHVDEDIPRTPSPSLSSLDELISRASEAGLQVHAELSGNLKELPASVDLAAFRIIQEALTNVMRHSGQTSSTVYVTCNDQELTLQIDNEHGNAAPHDGIRLGQGILGMKERATALGGMVDAGPRSEGGFRVLARLPMNGKSSTSQGVVE